MTLPQFGQQINRQEAAANGNGDGGASDYPEKLKPDIVRWALPGWYWAGVGTENPSNGRLYYIPFFVEEATTYIRIGISIQIAGGGGTLCRLGIYNWTDGLPSDLVLDAGTVAIDSTGDKEIVISEALGRGYYFAAFVNNSTPQMIGPNIGSAVKTPVAGIGNDPGATLGTVVIFEDGRAGDVAGGLPSTAPLTTLGRENASFATVFLREN